MRAVSALILACLLVGAADAQTKEKEVRNTKHWDLAKKDQLAIGGYDPVAYFKEGGGKPRKGAAQFGHVHAGVKYHFASQQNLERFKKNPRKYEPAYGGWCAWAMRDGEKVGVDPKSFLVRNERLFLFYDGVWGDTRAKWAKGTHDQLAQAADGRWKKISGEDPRKKQTLPKKP